MIDSAPSEDEPGFESLIGFDGKMTIGPGEILTWWLLTAPLAAIIVLGKRELLEEE